MAQSSSLLRAGRVASRLVVIAIFVSTVLYGCVVAKMHEERRELIYRFNAWPNSAQSAGPPGEVVELPGPDGTPLALWIAAGDSDKPAVLHFGGNAGVLRRAASRARPLAEAGHSVVVMNYRGAGGMPGEPSEAAITADALHVFDRLDDLVGPAARPPVVYGASLGAAVAVSVAATREVSGVVLAAPFARLCEVAEHHYPFMPACIILSDERWDSADRIAEVDAPVLVLHGARDRIIPVAQAEALAEAAVEPKRLVIYPAARHRDLADHGAREAVLEFVSGL